MPCELPRLRVGLVNVTNFMPPDEPTENRSSLFSTVMTLAVIVLLIAVIYGLSMGTAGPALAIAAAVFALVRAALRSLGMVDGPHDPRGRRGGGTRARRDAISEPGVMSTDLLEVVRLVALAAT